MLLKVDWAIPSIGDAHLVSWDKIQQAESETHWTLDILFAQPQRNLTGVQ